MASDVAATLVLLATTRATILRVFLEDLNISGDLRSSMAASKWLLDTIVWSFSVDARA